MKNISSAIRKAQVLLLLIGSVALISCGGKKDKKEEGSITISGQILYERVPATKWGLDYTNILELPVRRCQVKILENNSEQVLGNTYTDNSGYYAVNAPVGKMVKVVVYSQTQNPNIRVQDNFTIQNGERARYAIQSSPFLTEKNSNITKNLVAESGYDAALMKVLHARAAAPFAIIDNCLQASDFFLQERDIAFPPLTINWSISNSTSTIGTSSWNGSSLYILGDLNQDTDEYDQHVIVHEWGHYFENTVGRTDSIGGPHTDGDVLDPRLAFSEGWGNALSAMVLYPDSLYKDTAGVNQAITGILFDVDENNYELGKDDQFEIGWFSENSVQAILYDLFDPIADDMEEPWDHIASSAGIFYDIFSQDIKQTEAFVTIFPFINAFQKKSPSVQSDIDLLLAKHQIDPVQDDFGSEETHSGGLVNSLPIYKTLLFDSSVKLEFPISQSNNMLASNQYIKISGLAGMGTIKAAGATLKTVELSYKGSSITKVQSSSTIQLDPFLFEADKTYVVMVSNRYGTAATITVSLILEQ